MNTLSGLLLSTNAVLDEFRSSLDREIPKADLAVFSSTHYPMMRIARLCSRSRRGSQSHCVVARLSDGAIGICTIFETDPCGFSPELGV